MRILVTGGAGFIGSHICDKFVALGHEVHVLDDLSGGSRANIATGAGLSMFDVRSRDAATAVRTFAPDVVCHHAAQMDVRKSVTDPAFDADVNVVGLLNIVEAARLGGKLQHVLFASSGGAMYGEQDAFPAVETHAVRPESPYGLAKAVCEQYLAWYHRAYGITYTALRYGNVYGPRQNPHGEAGVVAIFTRKILDGAGITINGDGLQTRDYVYIDDVVAANALALSARPIGGFNIGTAVETTVVTLAQVLVAASHKAVAVVHGDARAGEQRRSVIDAGAFAAITGWRPTIFVDDGLTRTYDWFASRA